VLHFGGQVVKNVAGYDVSRLLAGSLGTLGLILEVSVKVLPKPVAEATLKFEMNDTDAVRKLNEWSGHPLPLTGSAWRDHTLALRLGGAEAAVKAARTSLGGEVVDAVEAERFWCGLREQSDPCFVAAVAAIDCRADASSRPASDGMGRRATLVDHRRRSANRAHQRQAGRWPRDHLPIERGV